MTCTTCHDPHDVPRGEAPAQHYVSVCRSCHGEQLRDMAGSGRHTPSDRCMDCHMPKRRTDDAVHVVMTDHHIQARPPALDLSKARTESHDGSAYRGEVELYYPSRLPDEKDQELYLAVAQVAQSANLQAGIGRLQTALEKYRPAEGGFYFELGKAYLENNAFDRAAAMFEEASNRMTDFWPALHRLGLSLSAMGQADRAVRPLELASRQATEGTVLNDLALLYRRLGRTGEAVAALKKSVATDPGQPNAYNNLGGMLLDQRDASGAEAAFMEAVRLQPDLSAAQANLAQSLAKRGDFEGARYHFEQAIKTSQPGEPARLQGHLSLGEILALQGDRGAARSHFEEALRMDPNSAAAHLGLGNLFAAEKRVPEARAHLQKAAQSGDPIIRQAALDALKKLQ